MATVYEVKITSHWINYHPEDLKKLLEQALYNEDANEVTVEIKNNVL